MMDDETEHPFDPMDYWLHENMVPDPWQLLSDNERNELALLARRRLQLKRLKSVAVTDWTFGRSQSGG